MGIESQLVHSRRPKLPIIRSMTIVSMADCWYAGAVLHIWFAVFCRLPTRQAYQFKIQATFCAHSFQGRFCTQSDATGIHTLQSMGRFTSRTFARSVPLFKSVHASHAAHQNQAEDHSEVPIAGYGVSTTVVPS